MCSLGVVWSIETEDASTALRARNDYLAAVRRHEGWKIDEPAAEIVYGELVGNAVRHAGGPVQISLGCVGQSTFLTVVDNGPGFKFQPNLPPNALAENGRGLFIASKFAIDIRVEKSNGGGTRVIAQLPSRPSIVT